MKKQIALLLVLTMMFSITACGIAAPQNVPAADTTADGFDVATHQWSTEPGNDKYKGRTLRLLLSVGGGGNYYEAVALRMMEYYPGLTVELNYTQGVGDMLRTEILSQNAPDIFNCNVVELSYYFAIEQGISAPIDSIFAVPTMDGSKTLGQIMDMEKFVNGAYEGKHYVMHEIVYLNGLWYDVNFFEKNGLTVPMDWNSLQKLAQECDALGMDVLGACGQRSFEYATNYWWWPMVAGTDYGTYLALQNLDYHAFKGPGMQAVVEKMLWLRDNGYYNTATNSMGNAETQVSFINHDFALLPCGAWLETEMVNAWPEDWELGFLPYSFGDTSEDAYVFFGGLSSMVSKNTRNMDLVCEFYRFLFSDEKAMRGSAAIHNNYFATEGYTELCGDLMTNSVKNAVVKAKSMKNIANMAHFCYNGLDIELGNMIVDLMGGKIDGETFMQRGYDLLKDIALDDSITKYTFED